MSEQSKMHKQGIWPILVMLLVYLFLYMPILVVVVYSFNQNASNMTFQGFTLRWYAEVLHGSNLWGNLFLSLKLSFVSMMISVVLGTLATIGTYRYEFRLKKYLNGLLYIPLVIPELVIGLASLAAFSRMGLRMGFGTLVFAHVTFCLPFVIITLRARIADFDRSLEEAAMDLGANEWRTMKRVTLPILAPGILAGAFMSITLSIDDVIISYFVSGSDQLTFPIKVYGMVRGKISTQVYVVSSLLIFVVMAVWLIGMAVRASYQRRHPE